MPYNSLISRDDAAALIPEEAQREIIQAVVEDSAILSLGRRLANMTRAQYRMPSPSWKKNAYFVNPTDTGKKQTTEINWENKYINAEEVACIVPIPEAVLDDSAYAIWDEVKPQVVAAIGLVIDDAVFFGTNAPATWPTDLLAASVAAGNDVTIGAGADIYADVLGVGGVVAQVEADGYFPSGHVADLGLRARMRDLRDADGGLIFSSSVQGATSYAIDGDPMVFPRNGSMDATQCHMFSGDWRQLVYSIRQDVTFKLETSGVIQDATGAIVYNLFQQDMVALRVVMRLGWQVPNPINRIEETEGDRYPFGVLIP